MITALKPWLKQILNTMDIKTVFTDPEDESRIKGSKYAWIYAVAPERATRDGQTLMVKQDDFFLREYELHQRIGIRLALSDEIAAAIAKATFMNALAGSTPVDGNGFDIEIAALSTELVSDKSVLKTGAGYDIVIEATGGIYAAVASPQIDAWAAALAAWTTTILSEPWKTYVADPVGKPDCTLFWSISGVEIEEKGLSHYLLQKKLTAKIYGPNDRTAWAALRILESLQREFKIPLDASSKKYMTVVRPELGTRHDSGQVTVTLTRNITRPSEEVPLIGRIATDGRIEEA